MGIPVHTISKTGVGQSGVYAPDFMRDIFNVGIQAVASGTVTYSVEYTLDDITDPNVTPTWTAATGFSALTASANGQLQVPCRGIRANVTAGTGGVTVTLCQAGIG